MNSTTTPIQDDSGTIENQDVYKAAKIIWSYAAATLIIVGTLGNIMSIIVLLRKRMRCWPTMFYLTVLAFAHIVVLFTGLLRYWIMFTFGIDIRLLSDFSCRFHVFSVYFSLDFAVWILVAVTVDRCICVCNPFRAKQLCTLSRAKINVCVIAVILFLVNHHFLWMYRLEEVDGAFRCTYFKINSYAYFANIVWPWTDFVVFSCAPFLVMIICNALIIQRLIQSRKRVLAHGNVGLHIGATSTGKKPLSGCKTCFVPSITTMLLTVNGVFLLTTLPIVIFLIGIGEWSDTNDVHTLAIIEFVWCIVNILQYLNNAIHIFLYCLTGPRFREELVRIFRRQNRIMDMPKTVTADTIAIEAK